MLHEEVEILDKKYNIKASIKIPTNVDSKVGVVLVHGGIINRKSLLRIKHSFGEYLCDILGAYIIAPDFLGETLHKKEIRLDNYSEILNISTKFLAEKYKLDEIMGFGHSMGSYVLANALPKNRLIGSIVNYGGPIKELENKRQKNFFQYLINYLQTYDYGINLRHLVKYVFDKETSQYLLEVMLKDEDYGFENYDFKFDSYIIKEIINVSEQYIDLLKKWNKPTLLLFGSNDILTKKTCKFYDNNFVEDNITIKHVLNASHITPCMESIIELSKLNPAVSFYVKNHKIVTKQRPKKPSIKSTVI
jgi:pimeloyl-ACP methyl ester carboxylesterase